MATALGGLKQLSHFGRIKEVLAAFVRMLGLRQARIPRPSDRAQHRRSHAGTRWTGGFIALTH